MEISFPTDRDGFISRECPSCDKYYKVCVGHGSEEPISYCPYCGYNGQNCWHTPEQINHMKSMAADILLIPKLKKLGSQFKSDSSISLKIDIKSQHSKSSPPMETDDNLPLIHFPCCNETIKVSKHEKHFCIICGVEVDMVANESKKIFLSHKGEDKNQVREYKNTLQAIGYEPWIDDDAMPAGTSLERGLLKGMQDSCGVVFFITPSFKDTGYLETEVNYAIQEKRKKGDKFSIITLQFDDDHGKKGEIPELLR